MALSDEIYKLNQQLQAMHVIFNSVSAALANDMDRVYLPPLGSDSINMLLEHQMSINNEIAQAYRDLDKMYQVIEDIKVQVFASIDKAKASK